MRTPLLLPILGAIALRAQPTPALQQLNTYLNNIGIAQAEQRAQKVARIQTRAEAEQRQSEVRNKILSLIGGLPEKYGPVRSKTYGSVSNEGFRIEKVAYESLPNFYVTANVFVPDGAGPFPAIVETPGHGAGKQSEFNWAANFARAGILVLTVDPIGQGERMQHWDAEIANSKIERLGEHEHASLSALLIGDHVSRYFINDGIRGVDYLTQRKDVDRKHIGAFGCSGGGTITAYLAALEPRISAAATACFITSLKELFPTQGPQDAEQTLPFFSSSGLDFGDWVELVAPRPYAIVSTTADMFPYAGAKQTYDEAKRFYGLFGAEDKLQWITGPGGHGNLGPIANQILGFLVKNLKGDSAVPEYKQFRPPDDDLTATPSGQISISLHSKTAEDFNREHSQKIIHTPERISSQSELKAFQERTRTEVRTVSAVEAQAGAAPGVSVSKQEQRDGYREETVSISSESGIELKAIQGIPNAQGPHPVVMLLDETPIERIAVGPDFTRLAKSDRVVIALQLRGVPVDAQNGQSQLFTLGPYMGVNLRAIILGKTLVGMRADDIIRAVNWLSSRADVDKTSLTLYARGGLGMAALHAAALDERITRVMIENSLVSYKAALDAPLHRNLSEITIPGVLRHYDVDDLLVAIAPREVMLLNPTGAVGQTERLDEARRQLSWAFDTDKTLGYSNRIRILKRGLRDPLPIE
jgi:cephalosporin-C deacetylase-like acetyl esterase